MRWHKLGLLYAPEGRRGWDSSHAMLPTPLRLFDRTIRLYLAHLDRGGIGRIGHIDVELTDNPKVVAAAAAPTLDIGLPGDFDDNGVVPSCLVPVNGTLRLYYSGFQLQSQVPYTIFSGVATASDPSGPFERLTRIPALDRREGEHFFRAAPFVLAETGRWRMWYIGGSGWIPSAGGKMLPSYSLRHMESGDGLTWSGPSVECLTPDFPDEIGFGRPFIIRDEATYRMWLPIRSRSGYRIGYATSPDGLRWERQREAPGIECSLAGWDSEMVTYPVIVRVDDRWIMFYNGNGYGRTGVGAAIALDG
jgi:hypothetical protein